jgi:hypothetical protein
MNYPHAAYEFIGINSLVHLINGGEVKDGPIGVYSEGVRSGRLGPSFR